MFGEYKNPDVIKHNNICINFDAIQNGFLYSRIANDFKCEKIILSNNLVVTINPVEPVNIPSEITSYLLIEFTKSLIVQPNVKKTIFLTFPIEIGVFLPDKQILDVFSLSPQKFTLYGDPQTGIICKYCSSDIYPELPKDNTLQHGILELQIHNSDSNWITVKKVLLKAENMKIFFDYEEVYMRAKMKLIDEDKAEIEFMDTPHKNNLKRSIELFSMKKLSVSGSRILMLEGL